MKFLKENVSNDLYISVMSQYYPAYKASSFQELSKRISREDYARVVKKMDELGLTRGWIQPFEGVFDEKFAGETFRQNL